ncbi:MAG: hypothetical protein K2G01_06820 [Paramuribaculum sp.]|nr:hypothetical protein [Paramuribaculum sp.]
MDEVFEVFHTQKKIGIQQTHLGCDRLHITAFEIACFEVGIEAVILEFNEDILAMESSGNRFCLVGRIGFLAAGAAYAVAVGIDAGDDGAVRGLGDNRVAGERRNEDSLRMQLGSEQMFTYQSACKAVGVSVLSGLVLDIYHI